AAKNARTSCCKRHLLEGAIVARGAVRRKRRASAVASLRPAAQVASVSRSASFARGGSAVLDLRFVLDNLDAVREDSRNRRVTLDLDRLASVAKRRSELMQQVEEIRRKRNELNKGAKGRGPDPAAAEEGRRLKDAEAQIGGELKQVEA